MVPASILLWHAVLVDTEGRHGAAAELDRPRQLRRSAPADPSAIGGSVRVVLAPYRDLFTVPGTLKFAVAGFVARLPISMVGIGIVLLISSTTGSYGIAGAVAALYSLAASLVGPQVARLVDKYGQATVLVPVLVVQVIAMIALMAAAVNEGPRWTLFVAGVIAGAATPSIGSLVRARWASALAGTGRSLQTAYALESSIDELIFVIGPVLVTVLATSVHRLAGLTAVLVLTLGGGLALAAQRSTQPLPRRSGADGSAGGSAIRSATLRMIILIMIGLGGVFGSVEVIVVAFADEHGSKGAAGYVLASWALGSLISGVLYGAVHWRTSLGRRLLIACPVFALSIVPLPFVPSLPVLAAVVFVAGFTISPTLIAAFGLVEDRVPAAQLTEGLTWSTTGIGLGITVASALAGQVIDDHGASDAFFVSVGSGICAAAVALLAARTLTRSPHGARDLTAVEV
jgi:MFS family permease